MKRSLNVAAAVAVGLSLITATTAAGAEKVTVAFVGADLVDPYYKTMHCGASAAAKKFNVNLTWLGINGVDFAPEVTAFNAVVQKKPAAIVLVPFSSTAFMQPVKAAQAAGIPVVTADAALAKPIEFGNVRTDNLVLGGLAADSMNTSLKGKGSVAVVSFAADVPVQADRVNGFKKRIAAKYPGLKVVSVEYGGADAGKSAQKVAALIQRFPDLGGVFATDTNDAEGAGSAILAAGKRGKIKLVAYDASPKEVQGLKTGLFDALVAQAPYDAGYGAIKLAASAARGGAKPKVFWQHTGGAVITKANVGSAKIKTFLYRETC